MKPNADQHKVTASNPVSKFSKHHYGGKGMKKILIAIDESNGSLKAVEQAGQQYGGTTDLHITLFHVLPNLPTTFWDDGHVLTKREMADRKKVIDKWLDNQKLRLDPLFKEAIAILTKEGISRQQIETKSVSETEDIAESILDEAKDGGHQVFVIGRNSYSEGERIILGSVTAKIINLGPEITVSVV
jgi:nucleotide-binding universal stress UspA family protein